MSQIPPARRLLRSALLGAALALAPAAAPAVAQVTPTAGPAGAAPGPGLRFYGLGRAFVQQADLGGDLLATDTTTARALADGEFVLDLAANAQPSRAVEVQGVLRLRNEFGGFFGAGVTVEVRELWARGVVADAVEYRLGDMDYVLTPFTVFLPDADATVRTPEVFAPLRERVAYEEFDTGRNTRRLQGGSLRFGLDVDQGVETVDARAFLTRLRPTDFLTTPSRYLGGGRLAATSVPFGPTGASATLGANLASTWDDLRSGDANEGIRNHVLTFDGTITGLSRPDLALALVGEGGWSVAKQAALAVDTSGAETQTVGLRERDTFVELGVEARLPARGLTAGLRAVDVGPDFFSAAAQSTRVDYTRTPAQFGRLGNARGLRAAGLFDLSRDAGLYTYRVADQLMTYDPRYGNVLPYGRATPNRRGVRLDAAYAPAGGVVDATLAVALLREIRGQGTTELKRFAHVRAGADVALAPLVGYGRALTLTLGTQLETTRRDGDPLEAVDLTSVLAEAGLAAEVYDRLDVLAGAVLRSTSGREYVPQYENFNDIRDFPGPFVTDDRERLLGAGLRYRFGGGSYLTVQYQHYGYGDDATPADDPRVGQVFALFHMPF